VRPQDGTNVEGPRRRDGRDGAAATHPDGELSSLQKMDFFSSLFYRTMYSEKQLEAGILLVRGGKSSCELLANGREST
jgi:hypothetical protein